MQKKLGSVQNWSAYQINRIFDSRHILFTRYHSSLRREAKSRQSSCLGSSYSIIMRELLSFKHISFWHMKMDSKLNLEIASKENSWNSLTYKFTNILRVQFGKSKIWEKIRETLFTLKVDNTNINSIWRNFYDKIQNYSLRLIKRTIKENPGENRETLFTFKGNNADIKINLTNSSVLNSERKLKENPSKNSWNFVYIQARHRRRWSDLTFFFVSKSNPNWSLLEINK